MFPDITVHSKEMVCTKSSMQTVNVNGSVVLFAELARLSSKCISNGFCVMKL